MQKKCPEESLTDGKIPECPFIICPLWAKMEGKVQFKQAPLFAQLFHQFLWPLSSETCFAKMHESFFKRMFILAFEVRY